MFLKGVIGQRLWGMFERAENYIVHQRNPLMAVLRFSGLGL